MVTSSCLIWGACLFDGKQISRMEWVFFLLCLAMTFHILYLNTSLAVLVFKTCFQLICLISYFFLFLLVYTYWLKYYSYHVFLTHLNCWNNQFLDRLFISAYTCTAYFLFHFMFLSNQLVNLILTLYKALLG